MLIDLNDYVPFIFVDHSMDCSYADKAANVEKRGGRVMVLASDSNILDDSFNVDDPIENVGIPTVIITKEAADIFREYIKLNSSSLKYIILSIKFSGVKENKALEMEMFFRSDDIKALNFFAEFEPYKEKLGEKFIFIPRYKYSNFVNENYNNELKEDLDVPCIKESKLCATGNNQLQIHNGRIVLFENIRQSCIYQTFGLNIYWSYMITFNSLCADLNYPTFNEKCSNNALIKIVEKKELEPLKKCMEELINNDGKIEEDYYTFNNRRIYSVPDLYLNGIPYRGSWFSKFVFNSICDGFIDDSTICKSKSPAVLIKNSRVSRWMILGIVLLIFIMAGCSLLCYKRIINRNLEETLNERIQEQAIKSISKYNVFKENQNMHKLELANDA